MNGTPYLFILAGGRGERLWPLSSEVCRKPFLKLFRGKSLLELTLERVRPLTTPDRIRILTARDLKASVQQAVPDFPETQILCEPEGRNTAAALAFACGTLLREAPDAVAVVLPADHLIEDTETFRAALTAACELAQTRREIVTVGIQPASPSTAYGYIACGEALPETAGCHACCGAGFTEKPDLATAKAYVNTGQFLWNAGIFVWTAQTLHAHFQRDAAVFLPLIETPAAADSLYPALPSIAFDYAIMEHCTSFTVVRGAFDWDDAGTFTALERHAVPDAAGNRALGKAVFDGVTDCTVFNTEDNHRVILAGLTDCFVAHTPDVTYIAPRSMVHSAGRATPPAPPSSEPSA